MSTNDQHDDQLDDQAVNQVDDQQVDDVVEDVRDTEADRKKKGAAAWMISAAVHAAVLTIAALAVFTAPKLVEQDTPPVRVNPIEPPAKKEDKPKPERTLEAKIELEAPTEADKPAPVSKLDVPAEVSEKEAEADAPQAKGREEAIADAETGGAGAFMAIGAGGGSAGMFGNRSGGGRKRAVAKGGGSKGSEGAVENSLRWFKRHQSPNGSWESDKYYQNCTEGAKCEPGKLHDSSDANVAMTSYSILCFLGAGYDHKTPNKYKTTVKKGIDWLISVQKADGYMGKRNYEHPIAVMALAEAYAMTADPELRGPAQKGVDQVLARQNQDATKGANGYTGGMGWDYVKPTGRNDSSVTGWNIMALKSALAGGLNVGRGMEGAKYWMEAHWKASNAKGVPIKDGDKEVWKEWKDITPYDKSRFFYSWNHDKVALEGDYGRESIGLVCGIFLGHMSGDVMAESLANTVMERQLPRRYPTNTYYMYYNTMAIFQMGGDRWNKWNGVVRDMLVNAQIKSTDCLDGSWEWQGTGFHGHELGRVLTTAYNTLCLEVYYRYAQVKDLHKR
jgi:hypothetical protein